MPEPTALQTLQHVVHSTPIIDNHAHPLVKLSAVQKFPLLAVATEAHGDALSSSRSGLPHMRAVRHLAKAAQCEATWEAVEEAIRRKRSSPDSYAQWTRRCLRGIQVVLVDDGLDSPGQVESYRYFDEVTTQRGSSTSKRILRIEQAAAPLVEKCLAAQDPATGFQNLRTEFMRLVVEALRDPEVVAFKSVICYRTGLAIPFEMDPALARNAFVLIWNTRKNGSPEGQEEFKRLEHPGLNEYLVHLVASAIDADPDKDGATRKPIQFHTGLGDNDITLTTASPSHLQPFIRRWPAVPIVLLHSGYPFVRETGYLATMYSNVYADVGEVFPFLSRGGQEGVLRQILELCPGEKILWSTDGHWFPETYLLAVEQMRNVLTSVLGEFITEGDLSLAQAAKLVRDVLFNNANRLYNLGLEEEQGEESYALRSAALVAKVDTLEESPLTLLTSILSRDDAPRFLRVYFNDMTGTSRMKCVPIQRALSALKHSPGQEDFALGFTQAAGGLLQNDLPAQGVSAANEWRLHPDFTSLRLGPRKGHVTTFGNFKEKDGSPVSLCPRTLLQNTINRAKSEGKGLSFLVGFEIELVLMRRVNGSGGGESTTAGNKYEPLDTDGHAWCVSRAMEHDAAISVLEPAISALEDAGISIESYHPESAPGQYEVILPATDPLRAVENLLFARDVLSNAATSSGYRMTLHPKPFSQTAGTAAHVHISLSTPEDPHGADPELHEAFYAGILTHLRAISAFTYSSMPSYDRIVDFAWSGGTYIAWGTQNRETPLRKVEGSHWEVKCLDGMANPYLALSAILSAGLDGLKRRLPLKWGDCASVPASLSPEARKRLGIVERFPSSLGEALEALKVDPELTGWMGEGLVERYIHVKEAETRMLEDMGSAERHGWILERY